MSRPHDDVRTPILAALGTGIALELVVAAIGGRREAWDSGLYWGAGLPAAAAIAGVLGYLFPRRAWLWGLLILPAQVSAMMLRSGEISGLWPLMVVLAAVLGAPLAAASAVGGIIRRRTARQS
jgi:hypothetical protein